MRYIERQKTTTLEGESGSISVLPNDDHPKEKGLVQFGMQTQKRERKRERDRER